MLIVRLWGLLGRPEVAARRREGAAGGATGALARRALGPAALGVALLGAPLVLPTFTSGSSEMLAFALFAASLTC